MKLKNAKKLLLAVGCGIFVLSTVAQDFALGQSVIEKIGSPDQTTIDLNLDITNVSGIDIEANVTRASIDIGNTINNFCWGVNCYPPNVSESTQSELLENGQTNSSFKGQLYPGGEEGNYIVRYCVKNVNGQGNNLCFNAKYIATRSVSLEEYKQKDIMEVGNVYPNPIANGVAIFTGVLNSSDNANIEILNTFGQVVKSIEFNAVSDAVFVDVSDLDSGMYLYRLSTGDKMSVVKKMIIK